MLPLVILYMFLNKNWIFSELFWMFFLVANSNLFDEMGCCGWEENHGL